MTMKTPAKTPRTCPKGHAYSKSSDCPVCPICEKIRKPKDGFLAALGAPARRALENAGVTTLAKLSRMSVSEISSLHGMGPSSIPKLVAALNAEGKAFRKEKRR